MNYKGQEMYGLFMFMREVKMKGIRDESNKERNRATANSHKKY